jgi:formylglycine-generating enzyme required for sulfatase activity
MIGNVWEWVGDWYGETYYANSPSADPTGPSSGEFSVARGCSFFVFARHCRSTIRGWLGPGLRFEYYGFRLALPPEGSK